VRAEKNKRQCNVEPGLTLLMKLHVQSPGKWWGHVTMESLNWLQLISVTQTLLGNFTWIVGLVTIIRLFFSVFISLKVLQLPATNHNTPTTRSSGGSEGVWSR
jgi:hypothetical protein